MQQPEDFGYYGQLLALPEVRKSIHVGNLTYNDGSEVEKHLINDIMDTVKPNVTVLMDNYKVKTIFLWVEDRFFFSKQSQIPRSVL